MRSITLLAWGLIALGAALLFLATAGGAVPDATADRVRGQADFTSAACNSGGVSPATMCDPRGIAVSPVDGSLYVADTANNRVLWFADPRTSTITTAGLIIGQPGGTQTACNNGGISATSLCQPVSVDVDGAGNVYVADLANSRVLQYNATAGALADVAADRVFGQPDFTTAGCNTGGISAISLCDPHGVSADDYFGNVYVSDTGNNRVLGYFLPLTIDLVADRIFGQPDYISSGCNNGGVSATSLCGPRLLNFHGTQHLFVSDLGNDRVVLFDNPLFSPTADVVLGQPDFSTAGCNSSGIGPATLCSPRGVAIDEDMNTYIADYANRRILRYDDPLLTDSVAEAVYGQPDFTTTACWPSAPTASSFCYPHGAAVNFVGDLYIGEDTGNRLLGFDRCPGDRDCDTVADASDNCANAPNPSQQNTDRSFIDNPPPLTQDDTSRPMSDTSGDACDDDDDNDGLLDGEAVCPSATAALNSTNPDTDGDAYVDAAECAIGTDPASNSSKPTADQCRMLAGAPLLTTDSDSDRLQDRIEVCGYATSVSANDSDGDGSKDQCEVASLNTLAPVNSLDQLLLAQSLLADLAGPFVWNADLNKDGANNSADQLLMSQIFMGGGC